MKILIVDDSKTVHSFIKALLSDRGHEFDSAYDGTEVVSKIEAGNSWDLILLDLEMPKLDGLGTIKEVRAKGIDTPVVMVTSRSSPDDVQKLLEYGADEYVMKPFTKEILIEKVSSILSEGAI